MHKALGLVVLALSACSARGGPYPSLQPRAVEAIDPRVPIVRPMNSRPVTAALKARLEVLVDQAQRGNSAFDGPALEAERLAAKAGAPKSEDWIAAEEALTAAISARKETATALGDIDAMAATALQNQGGIAPNDLAAIQSAALLAGSLDQRQAERIHALQQQLGL